MAAAKVPLKSLLRKGQLLVVPGVFDGISLRVAEKVGFRALYMTGFGTVGSHLGSTGGYRDMVERVRSLASMTSAPLVCDASTSFGGLLMIPHAVRGYEAAGASAIHIEDRERSKQSGHSSARCMVPLEDTVARIKKASEARLSSDLLIVARTHARSSYGLDEALRRGEAFAKAGADILFIEALETEAELERVGRSFDMPLLVHVVEGGKTPVLSPARYAALGFQMAIYPATGFLAMGKSLEHVYGHMKNTGSSIGTESHLANFNDFRQTMGFEDVSAFDRAC